MEPAPDTSWLRMECTLCHESFGIDDDHRCPRRAVLRAVLLNALPFIVIAAVAAVALCALLWVPR